MDPAPSPIDVEALLARYRATGDPRAFAAVFDATAAELHHVAFALLDDAAAAEDAVQETYVAALGALAGFESGRRVMPWLVGILQHKLLHARRGARRRDALVRAAAERGGRADASGAEDAEPTFDVSTARPVIEALDEPYRSVALLRWRYGLAPAEIAHVRGEPPGTTRSLLSRALDRLRRALGGGSAMLGIAVFPRGLDAVRAEVVREASRAAVVAAATGATGGGTIGGTAGGGGGVAVIGGGLVVGKIVGAVIGVAALVLVGVFVLRPRTPHTSAGDSSEEATAPSEIRADASKAALASAPTSRRAAPSEPSRTVTGRVIDPEGKAIAGAVIDVAPESPEASATDEVAPAGGAASRVASNAEGRFEASVGAEPVTLVVGKAGRASAVLSGVRAGQDKVVVLRPAFSLVGRVIDAELRAVPGARVRVAGLLDASVVEREAISDAEGRYRVPDLPFPRAVAPGTQTRIVEVTADGFAPLLQELKLGRGAVEDPVDRDWVLARGARVFGRVLDDESGRPVGGARVVLLSHEGPGWSLETAAGKRIGSPFQPRILARTTTSDEGAYAFEHVPTRGWHDDGVLRASGPKGPRLGSVIAWTNSTFVTADVGVPLAQEGAVLERDVRVRSVATVSGRVVDAGGAPVRGVSVKLAAGKGASLPWVAPRITEVPTTSATTDSLGRYELTGVPASDHGDVDVRLEAWPRFGVPLTSTEPDGVLAFARRGTSPSVLPDLVLSAEGPTLTMRVLSSDGGPISGATVRIEDPYDPYPWGFTDEGGMFRCRWPSATARPIAPTWRVSISSPGWATTEVEVPTHAPTGAPIEVRLAPGQRLRGVVRDASGRPADGAEARASTPRGATHGSAGASNDWPRTLGRASCDGSGHFEIDTLPPGPWMVTASSSPGGNGVFSDEVEVANGSADVELALSNGAAPLPGGASGTVVDDATGRPITDFSADRWPYVPYGEALRPGPGRFRFDGMPLGRSKLRFTAIGYEPAVVEVDVRGGANQAEPFVVRLGAGLSAFGRVIADPPLPPGRRLAWWSVDDSQFGPSSEPVGADGTFRIAGLKPGRYRVLSMRSEGEVQTGIALASRDDRIVEIPASAAGQPLEVELVRAGVLILSPRPAAPNPSVAAPAGPRPPSTDGATRTVRLIVRRPGGAVLSDAKVDAANFGLHAVVVAAPGPIVIRVEAEDGRSTDQVAEIPEGPGVGMASVTLP